MQLFLFYTLNKAVYNFVPKEVGQSSLMIQLEPDLIGAHSCW